MKLTDLWASMGVFAGSGVGASALNPYAALQNAPIPEHMLRAQQNMATAWFEQARREQLDRAIEIHEVHV